MAFLTGHCRDCLLLKDIQTGGDIKLSEAQDKIVEGLLAESDSLRHFLMENVVQDEKADLSTTEIVEAYAEYCPLKGWNPADYRDSPRA